MMSNDQIAALEKEAELNDGHCSKCSQTIKIYRYRINPTHATFLRAMADEVRNTGVNDVDVSTLGLPYSTRTQSSKIRQHGLIARIKNEKGAQIPRRWLITTKGWDFINGKPVPEKVVVFNNQVLGHDGNNITIHAVMGEPFKREQPQYEQAPVSEPEARTYEDVRTPKPKLEYQAIFKGHSDGRTKLRAGQTYTIYVDRMQVGRPIELTVNDDKLHYNDIARFQRDWKVL